MKRHSRKRPWGAEAAGKAVEVRSCHLNETRWFLKQPHSTFVIYCPTGSVEAAILQSGKEDMQAISWVTVNQSGRNSGRAGVMCRECEEHLHCPHCAASTAQTSLFFIQCRESVDPSLASHKCLHLWNDGEKCLIFQDESNRCFSQEMNERLQLCLSDCESGMSHFFPWRAYGCALLINTQRAQSLGLKVITGRRNLTTKKSNTENNTKILWDISVYPESSSAASKMH